MPDRTRPTSASPARTPRVDVALAACAFALPTPGEGNLIEMQLTPAVAFRPSDGRAMKVPAWRIDAAIAGRVIAAASARQTPLVVDYEHQTLLKDENGQPAPAAGWIRALAWREGQGLFATVELTQRARDYIAAGEYRYVSPVFSYDPATGDVLAIQMAAITNRPAIDGMAPLALRAAATFGFTPDKEPIVEKLFAAVITALSLANTASEDEAVAALTAKLAELADLRRALGFADTVAGAAAVAACSALKSKAETAPADPAKYVGIDVVEQLKTELAALTAKQRAGEVAALIERGLADGRLLPAQKDWAGDLGTKDLAALSAYLASAQPIAALRGTQTTGSVSAPHPHGLTVEEVAVCTATGIAPEDFAKAKAA